jgi:carboxymethylenebutenolidase
MSTRTRGVASYLVVAALAFTVGALGTWLVRSQASTAPQPLDAVTTHGEYIWITRGADSIWAYIAYPERNDRAPAMIVIHENRGLTEWEPTVADHLASKGYVAVAPDLVSSRFGPALALGDSVGRFLGQLHPDGVTADLDAVFDYLNSLPSVQTGQIGAMGFCWGGGNTFRYATNNPRLKAAVVCYGPNPPLETLSRIEAPVLGVYGENDARINAALPQVIAEMQRLGKFFEADSYPGTGHGFLKPGRRGNDSEQPARAWARIEAFLKEHLQQ